MKYKTNDLILRMMTNIVVFIIFGFSLALFFAGHNAPGGGFVGGLVAASGFSLIFLAYGIDVLKRVFKIEANTVIVIGILIALLTASGSFFFGVPFLSHTFAHVYVPFFGDIELTTALLFDLGVYVTVVGVAMLIIMSIAEDKADTKEVVQK